MVDINRYFDVEDMFCNLFTLAGHYGIKPDVFTRSIENHVFILCAEKGDYKNAYNESILDIFNSSLSFCLSSNETDGVYNDYYWVGKCYFYIQSETHKSFSYIFMKMPFSYLLSKFNPYHEMDMSQMLDLFYEQENKTTILKELCLRRKISISFLSKKTNIPESTLTKYRKNDDALYKASFTNIYMLSQFFDVPETLFLKTVPLKK